MSDEKKPLTIHNDNEEAMSITVKKSQIFTVLLPIVFLIGLGAGYFIWGYGNTGGEVTLDQEEVLSRLDDIEELLLGGGGAVAGDPSQTETPPLDPQEVTRYEIDIYEDDPTQGPKDAPITMIEFSDYECPFCRRFNLETFDQIMTTYEGQVQYIYKDFPLSFHANARPAALAALCAHEQDAFWDYRDKLFFMELPLGNDSYLQYAEDLNLDMVTFTKCLDEDRYDDRVEADFDFAANLGVSSTPTFFINGIPVIGAQDFEVFQQVIDMELAVGD
jgi:protein-disulfide isomerase